LAVALAAIAAPTLIGAVWATAASGEGRTSSESVYESVLGEGVIELEAIGGGTEEAAQATEAEAAEGEASGALSSLDLGDGASTLEELEVPIALLPIYQACGTRYGISWEVLAAINKVETGFGTDGDGDGKADTDDPVDAICSAARYLAASGGESNIYDAVFAYNHADWYVREVLADARRYDRVAANLVNSLTELSAGTTFPVAGSSSFHVAGAATASIQAEAGAEVLAVVDGTVAKVGENEALGRYVVLEDAYGDRFVYSDLGKVKVGAGDRVAEGDVLGTAGEAAIGFSARPDASPAVDPTELLELWRRGGVGKVYGVDAEGASAGSKSVRSLLMSAMALEREVLADEDL
ncbi:MAG: M23 family metallopeptidase, partial [Actinobacteria bacterium]|nr:M23 family metallopeptidase [Actinomycetota bacterium]